MASCKQSRNVAVDEKSCGLPCFAFLFTVKSVKISCLRYFCISLCFEQKLSFMSFVLDQDSRISFGDNRSWRLLMRLVKL